MSDPEKHETEYQPDNGGNPSIADASSGRANDGQKPKESTNKSEYIKRNGSAHNFLGLTRYELTNIILLVLLVLVNYEYTTYAGKQWQTMENQLRTYYAQLLVSKDSLDQSKQMLVQMKQQSDSIKENADASVIQAGAAKSGFENAKRSLQASIDNFHLDQRPWVVPVQFTLSNDPEVGKLFTVSMLVQNTGKTPALDVSAVSLIAPSEVEPPEPSLFTVEPTMNRGILSPGVATFSFKLDGFKPSLVDVAAYEQKRRNIYFHALIRYHESSKQEHWTRVCLFHAFGMPLGEFTFCNHGNDLDSEKQTQ